MDISKYHIPQLIGPNWGPWYERIQSTAHIINIWDVLRFNLVRVEIRELRPEVVAKSDEVLVHYRSRTNVTKVTF